MAYLEREVVLNDVVLGTFIGVLFDLCHKLLPELSYLGFLAGWRDCLDPSVLGLPTEISILLNIKNLNVSLVKSGVHLGLGSSNSRLSRLSVWQSDGQLRGP